MKIALLIPGRAARYEVCLLPILQKTSHEIDLFMSINDSEDCEYYNKMQQDLKTWLRGIRFEEYALPSDFPFDVEFNKPLDYHHQFVHGKEVPYNQMSMYYNTMVAFQMASNYEHENGIKYDLYMRFRSDVCNTTMPEVFERVEEEENKLYSVVPNCDMTGLAKHKVRIVSDAWAWSNRKTMSVYCDTYNYVLSQLRENNGKYLVHYESGITDIIYDNKIPVIYNHIPYSLDRHRRIFDKQMKSNLQPIYASVPPTDIKTGYKFDLPVDPIS
jgi:hypothetical protein